MLMQSLDIWLEHMSSLMHTPSDGDMGKFMWFLFRVWPCPFFLPFFAHSFFCFCPLPDPIPLSGQLGWLGRLGYPRCHWTGSSVSRFSDKLICSCFGDLGDGISQEICIEFWGSWRWGISRDIAKTCTHLRSVIREQRQMTPTVMSWVWKVDLRGSELDTIDNLCLQEIKLKADLYWYEHYIYKVDRSY